MRVEHDMLRRAGVLALSLAVALAGCRSPSGRAGHGVPSGGGFTLVKDGRPAATIVLADKPSKTALFAAEELNAHIQKITGARLPSATDAQAVSGSRVLVGESAATRALGLTSAAFNDQEYLVRTTPDTLVLIGKDDAEPPAAAAAAFQDVWVDGKWGKALAFNGRGTLFTADKHGFDDAEGTLECWLLVDDQPAGSGAILRLTRDRDHVILLRDEKRVRYRSIAAGKESFVVSADLAPGWHHAMATHSAGAKRIELLVDGQPQGTAPYDRTAVADATLYIGGFVVGFQDTIWTPLRGTLDEIRVSRAVRPPGVPGGPFAADADTTLLLHCDEGSGAPAGTVRNTDAVQLASLPGLFRNIGTLHAVYDFLERDCGVRWYAPGELGMVFDKRPVLTARSGERRRVPAMTYREISGSWNEERAGGTAPTYTRYEKALWSLRLRAGGENVMQGMHSFYGFRDRFSKAYGRNPVVFEADRPEFFAQGLTEAQQSAPSVPGGQPNLCYSNQALVEQVVRDARDYFDGKGLKPGYVARGKYFALGAMDMAPYCQCANCKAAMREPRDAVDRGYRSDYWFGFVNRIARELRKTHPDALLASLAYHDYAEPPSFPLEPNVSVTFCALGPSMWWDPARRERDRRAFDRGWAVQGKDHAFRLYGWLYYLGGMMGQTDSDYPEACASRVPEFMAELHAADVRGLYIQQASELGWSFLLSQLELYLALKLADDPALDGNALIHEFFTRYYGAAGPLMQQLATEMEAVKFDLANYPEEVRRGDRYSGLTREIAYRHLLTPERTRRWNDLLDRAVAAAQGSHKERLLQYKAGVWDRTMASRSAFLNQAAERVTQSAALPETVAAIADPCEEAACVTRWVLAEPGERMLAGARTAPHAGNDCLKVIPGNVVQGKKRTSLRRQGQLAQSWFRNHLGVTARVGYCVDSFGHSAGLPSFLSAAGMRYYVFQRPPPREKPDLPNLFWWEAPDGARVLTWRLAHGYGQGPGCSAAELEKGLRNIWRGLLAPDMPVGTWFVGVGSHGGGPTRVQLDTFVSPHGDSPITHLAATDGEKLPLQWSAAEAGFGLYLKEWKKLVAAVPLPACGSRRFHLAHGEGPADNPSGRTDDRLTVFANSARLVVVEDRADTWGHDVNRWDQVLGYPTVEREKLLDDGPIFRRHRRWPAWGRSSLILDIVEWHALDAVEFVLHINWQDRYQAVKLELPLRATETRLQVRAPGAVVERPLDGDEWFWGEWLTLTVAAGRLLVVSDGASAYDATPERLRLTPLRCVPHAQYMNQPHPEDSPAPFLDEGYQEARFWLAAPGADTSEADLDRLAAGLLTPAEQMLDSAHAHEGTDIG